MTKIEKNRGFTLVELALVLLIMGLMFGTISPVYFHLIDSAKMKAGKEDIEDIAQKIDDYSNENGHHPLVSRG